MAGDELGFDVLFTDSDPRGCVSQSSKSGI